MTTMHSVSRLGRLGRRALRRFLYSQLAGRTGLFVALGKEDPLVRFTVEADPPSVYLVFRVPDPVALGRHLGLPAGMSLAPIRCLADDDPAYLIALNVYRVSGITNGLRAEWSTFIADATGTPRYLVVDARASNRSMDPVDVLTPATRVEYARVGDGLELHIGDAPSAFTATITGAGDAPLVPSHAEWVTANDTIYWRNGIYDRTFYDAGLAAARQRAVPSDRVVITDDTEWADFLDPEPIHTLVFDDAIQFVVSPWANVEDLR